MVENLGRIWRSRRKELERERGRILSHNIRDVHASKSIFVPAATFGQLTNHIFDHGRRVASKLQQFLPVWHSTHFDLQAKAEGRPAFRLALFVGKTRPPPEFPARSRTLDRRTFCWLEPFVDRCERFLKLARPRAVGPGQIPLPKMIIADSRLLSEVFTLMLLTVCAKGSEQLRTTQNKRRFCSCGWLIPVVHAKLVHTV